MAEVFQGTPVITTIAVWDQEGHKVEYNVAGRDLDTVKDVVLKALEAMPDQDQSPEPRKSHRKPRRTKAEMAAAAEPPETVAAGAGKPWAD
jgi:hypothetical protein